MSFSLQECVNWLGDTAVVMTKDAHCQSIGIDSRTTQAGELFAACAGKNTNGNKYISMALENGAAAVLTEEVPQHNVPILQVTDLARAIETIAQHRRALFTGTLVAITGSVGKTSTKNACAHMLHHAGKKVIATAGNYNNQLGVSLTLTKLETQDLAIVELGISQPNDMDIIAQLSQPHVSVITNVSAAHSANFTSLAHIASEKGKIIDHTATNGTVILNADDVFYSQWKKRANSRRIISIGYSPHADVRIIKNDQAMNDDVANIQNLTVKYDTQTYELTLNAIGAGALWSAVYAMAVAVACDMPLDITVARATSLLATAGRMEVIETGVLTIINDCYNANPASMQAALAALIAHANQRPLLFILGDMRELGEHSGTHHQSIGAWLNQHAPQTTTLWTVGSEAWHISHNYKNNKAHFAHTSDLLDALNNDTHQVPHNALLLLKASRTMELDTLLPVLRQYATPNKRR